MQTPDAPLDVVHEVGLSGGGGDVDPPVVGPSGVPRLTTETLMSAWSLYPSSEPKRYMMVG
jgi:hypothetical protein